MREMIPSDIDMVWDAMGDYPYTKDDGYISRDKVDGYMRRWAQQFHPYVLEIDGEPVGFINYQFQDDVLFISHIFVIPRLRKQGYGDQMRRWLRDRLIAEGHELAFFTLLEQSSFLLNRHVAHGEGEGQTGKILYGSTNGNF